MGDIIKIEFGQHDTPTQEDIAEKSPTSLEELYSKSLSTKLTPEIISSFREELKPYTFEELIEFMQLKAKETVTKGHSTFMKAVQQEIRSKRPPVKIG